MRVHPVCQLDPISAATLSLLITLVISVAHLVELISASSSSHQHYSNARLWQVSREDRLYSRSFYSHVMFALRLFFILHKIIHDAFNTTEICGEKEKHLLLKYKSQNVPPKHSCE